MDGWFSNDIREARHAWVACDRTVDDWLLERVSPPFDALRADRSKAKSADKLCASVATRLAGLTSLSYNEGHGEWTTPYADLIAAHNTFVAVYGLPLAKHRMF